MKTDINNSIENPISVSIIIPVLNEEKHLEKCLNSVFCQTYYSNIKEILVIDGGSTDRTPVIVNRLCSDHSNLFLLHNNKKIQAAAFNLGIDCFKADLLIRMDAHCTYAPNYVEYCAQYHRMRDWGNVGGRCIIEPASDTNMAKVIAKASSSRFGLGFAAYRVGCKLMLTDSVPFGSFTKQTLSIVGKMNESLPRGEDNEFNARIRENGYQILFDPKIEAYYSTPPNLTLLLKKMYDNGLSIGILIWTHRKSVDIRHIIPFIFFITLGTVLSLSLIHSYYSIFLITLLLIYFILIIISPLRGTLKLDKKLIFLYAYVVFLIHICYGIGTLIGLIKRKY